MKRHEFLEHLRRHGCGLVREGRRHFVVGQFGEWTALCSASALGNPRPTLPQDLP